MDYDVPTHPGSVLTAKARMARSIFQQEVERAV